VYAVIPYRIYQPTRAGNLPIAAKPPVNRWDTTLIFSGKRCKLRSANCRNEKPSCQKAERDDFQEENIHGPRNLPQNLRKGRIPKKLASKLKKVELNCTNLELNSKKTCLDHTKMPDPSVSSGLNVKNKTIRVLLDFGSSGDLLFMKKGSSKCISIVKQVVPQSWGTSNGSFITDRVGDIEISFVEYSASKKVFLQPDIVEYSPMCYFSGHSFFQTLPTRKKDQQPYFFGTIPMPS
jgi:hypothetical protein